MSHQTRWWRIVAGLLILMVVSLGSAVAVLTIEGIGANLSELVSRTTGIPTVYGSRDATRKRLDVVHDEMQETAVELQQFRTVLRDCEIDRAALPALLAEHEEQQRRLALATRVTRLLHSSINLGLTSHLQSSSLKALPTFGTGVVLAMTIAEMSLLCYQFDQVAELKRALTPDDSRYDRPWVCRPGTDTLAKAVYERIFRQDEDINWREECEVLQSQGVPLLDCNQFPTQGPVDPDATIGWAESLQPQHPVDPDTWIRENMARESLFPVDPN